MRKSLLVVVALGWVVGFAAAVSAAEPGKTCGTIAGIPCPDGLWCDLEAGQCGTTDLKGQCVAVPEICTEHEKPVCGCDGKTYGNDCKRQRAKAQKDHDGACKKS